MAGRRAAGRRALHLSGAASRGGAGSTWPLWPASSTQIKSSLRTRGSNAARQQAEVPLHGPLRSWPRAGRQPSGALEGARMPQAGQQPAAAMLTRQDLGADVAPGDARQATHKEAGAKLVPPANERWRERGRLRSDCGRVRFRPAGEPSLRCAVNSGGAAAAGVQGRSRRSPLAALQAVAGDLAARQRLAANLGLLRAGGRAAAAVGKARRQAALAPAHSAPAYSLPPRLCRASIHAVCAEQGTPPAGK